MFWRYLWGVPMLGVPRVVSAADLGPFADFSAVGLGVQALAYLLGGAMIVFTAVRAGQAYRDRDMGGMGPVVGLMALTVMEAIFVGTIVPNLIAPIMALGATL